MTLNSKTTLQPRFNWPVTISKIAFLLGTFLSAAYIPQLLAESVPKIRDGRAYILYLSKALEVEYYEGDPIYQTVKTNLPQTGSAAEFNTSKDSYAKIAGYFCDSVAYLMGDDLPLKYLYQRLLRRAPTEQEKKSQLTVKGKYNFYANCLVLAMHPQIIQDQRGRKKKK